MNSESSNLSSSMLRIWGLVFGALGVVTILLLGLPPVRSVEGDVLIHFVFARNAMAGDLFVYGYEQISGAGTSFLWKSLLAVLGTITTVGGTVTPEAWSWLARGLGLLFTGLAGLILWRLWAPQLPDRRARALVMLIMAVNPILWYWFFAHPMETSLATFLVCAFFAWHYGPRGAPRNPVTYGAGCAGFAFLFFLTRPELAVLPGFAALLQFLLERDRRSFLAGVAAGGFLALFLGLWFALLWWGEYPLLPTAATARRIYLRTNHLPGTSIWYSPDALVFGVFLFGYGALLGARNQRSRWGTPLLATLTVGLLFSVLFFAFYYTTTWRGRYMLPLMIPWIGWATAAWLQQGGQTRDQAQAVDSPPPQGGSDKELSGAASAKAWIFSRWFPAHTTGCHAALAALAIIYVVFLFPLHRVQGFPLWRQWPRRPSSIEFVSGFEPGTRIMAQEVQGALFAPELVYISTDGLIGGEAYDAYIRGLTVWEFWWEQKPELMVFNRYYLDDPEGVLLAANQAREAEGVDRFVVHGLPFERVGFVRGTGEAYRPLWDEAVPPVDGER